MPVVWKKSLSKLSWGRWFGSACAISVLLGSCVSGPTSDDSSNKTQSSVPPVAKQTAVDVLLDTADASQGRLLFLQCRACHSLEQGGENKVGPNLHGFFSRVAGQAKGFDYSEVLSNSGIVWTPHTVDQWLARPSDFLPGNRMVFAGVGDPADRADLIAYLRQETGAED